MASRLGGYRRLPGLARRYRSPSGEVISYRQYRTLLERSNLVHRLSAAELANARRRQRSFNDIVSQMAKVRGRALDNALENTRAQMDAAIAAGENDVAADLATQLMQLEDQRRTVKRAAIKSPSRKEALAELKRYHHPKTPADEMKLREALTILGRREGIPEWFPVGSYDRVTKLQFRKAA